MNIAGDYRNGIHMKELQQEEAQRQAQRQAYRVSLRDELLSLVGESIKERVQAAAAALRDAREQESQALAALAAHTVDLAQPGNVKEWAAQKGQLTHEAEAYQAITQRVEQVYNDAKAAFDSELRYLGQQKLAGIRAKYEAIVTAKTEEVAAAQATWQRVNQEAEAAVRKARAEYDQLNDMLMNG